MSWGWWTVALFKNGLPSVQEICSYIIGVPGKIRSVVAVGLAAILGAIWKTRNKASFENVFSYDPTTVILFWLTETRTMRNASQRCKNATAGGS